MLKKTLDRILRSDKPTPADEIRNAQRQIEQRNAEIMQRLDDIAENFQFSGEPGPARKKALIDGDPAAIVAMDDEHKLLKAELKTLGAQANELLPRLEEAERAEAAKRLPGLLKAHTAELKAYKQALAAMEAAKRTFDEHIDGIIGARRAVGDKAPALSLEQALEVADLKGFHESEKLLRYNHHRRQLCFDLAGKDNRPNDRTWRQIREFDQEAHDDGNEPERSSFWDKKEPGRAA